VAASRCPPDDLLGRLASLLCLGLPDGRAGLLDLDDPLAMLWLKVEALKASSTLLDKIKKLAAASGINQEDYVQTNNITAIYLLNTYICGRCVCMRCAVPRRDGRWRVTARSKSQSQRVFFTKRAKTTPMCLCNGEECQMIQLCMFVCVCTFARMCQAWHGGRDDSDGRGKSKAKGAAKVPPLPPKQRGVWHSQKGWC
jgi:hypothetical protein